MYGDFQMKQKKIMGIFLILFLISLSITIGLFFAVKRTSVNPKTVTATVISTEKININIGIIQRPRYIVTVRYNGHENKCYVSATAGHVYRPMQQVQAYISSDGTLTLNETNARTHSIIRKLYFVFLAITGVLFISFMVVHDKIWKMQHLKKGEKFS